MIEYIVLSKIYATENVELYRLHRLLQLPQIGELRPPESEESTQKKHVRMKERTYIAPTLTHHQTAFCLCSLCIRHLGRHPRISKRTSGPTPPRATLLPSPEALEWWQFQEAWCRVNENVRLKQLSGYTNKVVKFKGMFTFYVIII
jgi:hypothetical protein